MYESFVVLSRIEPLEVTKKTSAPNAIASFPNPAMYPTKTHLQISQRETIWFLPGDGEPVLYLENIERQNEGQMIDTSHDKNKIQDRDIFAYCTGAHFPAIQAFAKTSKLSFRDKEDLLLMLDYYETLVKK